MGLLSELIDLAKEAESEFVSLEVRCSNTPAISLYGKLGLENRYQEKLLRKSARRCVDNDKIFIRNN